MTTKSDIKTRIKPNLSITEPPMFKVVYMNDDKTTMDYVIESLVNYFDYSYETAENITTGIHEEGSAVVAVLPYEIAEQKGIEVTIDARSKGYPLVVRIEQDA
jgi:ATP-dependent Clp protease adaptor protein ClpS